MENNDKQYLLSLMYQDEPNEPTKQIDIDYAGFKRTRKVKVGAIEYELPTTEYVTRLENMINKQAAVIEQHKRDIDRLKNFMATTRNFIRRQTVHLADLQEDISHKIDSREFP